MKIGPKHTFTNLESPKQSAQGPNMTAIFKAKAPISESARPLTDRAQIKKGSKADEKLTKTVQSITGRIPTPFIKR